MGGVPKKKFGRYGGYDRYGRYGGYDALRTLPHVVRRELDKYRTVLPHPGQIPYNFGFLVLQL